MHIPAQLAANCLKIPERHKWLSALPATLEHLTHRWSLGIGPPMDHAHVTCSWVAPALRIDGTQAVLKLAMPHMEGAQEIPGLRHWNGNPTVQLLEADDDLGAMLLERCQPGVMLRSEPEHKQDVVIANLLKRLWRKPPSPNGPSHFRHLSEMLQYGREETLAQIQHCPDAALVRAGLVTEGLRLFEELTRPSPTDTLLATDLHAGNVLQAEREPCVVQHLHNCEARLHADPPGLVSRLADLAEVDTHRLRLWTFARAAADPRPDWTNPLWLDIAQALAP